jgi:hypothetical protein
MTHEGASQTGNTRPQIGSTRLWVTGLTIGAGVVLGPLLSQGEAHADDQSASSTSQPAVVAEQNGAAGQTVADPTQKVPHATLESESGSGQTLILQMTHIVETS